MRAAMRGRSGTRWRCLCLLAALALALAKSPLEWALPGDGEDVRCRDGGERAAADARGAGALLAAGGRGSGRQVAVGARVGAIQEGAAALTHTG
jgi:hypothetical protein